MKMNNGTGYLQEATKYYQINASFSEIPLTNYNKIFIVTYHSNGRHLVKKKMLLVF